MKETKHIVSFSGGKDSTAMLLMMLEKDMKIDKIIFCDTGKEFPQMYEHIEKVQNTIEPLEIEVVKIDFDYWFGKHIKTKGKSRGKKGYGFPDFRNRWCTALKREAVKKRQETNPEKDIQYFGIAFDEKKRTLNNKNRNIRYPLVEWGITEKQSLDYCYSKGFDWDGLYEKFVRVSCYCCPLQRLGELKTIYLEFPKLWEDMRKLDKLSWRKFRSDYSLQELENKFDKENEQCSLF